MSDTKHIEYARAVVARIRIQMAIGLLMSSRSEVSVTSGEQRKAVHDLDDALLDARRAASDVDHLVRMIGGVDSKRDELVDGLITAVLAGDLSGAQTIAAKLRPPG